MLIWFGDGSFRLLISSNMSDSQGLFFVQCCESLNLNGPVVAIGVFGDQDTRLRFLASLGDGG